MKKIAIIGDQVCIGYLPVVRNRLKKTAEVWSPEVSVPTTTQTLLEMREVMRRQPDLVFFATGLGDTRRLCVGESVRITELAHFKRNMQQILRLVLERSTAKPVWATIAPVDRRRISPNSDESGDFGYDNDGISAYNEEAKVVAASLGVDVLDVYGYVKAASRDDSWRPDGVNFDSRSSDYLAAKVAASLEALLG